MMRMSISGLGLAMMLASLVGKQKMTNRLISLNVARLELIQVIVDLLFSGLAKQKILLHSQTCARRQFGLWTAKASSMLFLRLTTSASKNAVQSAWILRILTPLELILT